MYFRIEGGKLQKLDGLPDAGSFASGAADHGAGSEAPLVGFCRLAELSAAAVRFGFPERILHELESGRSTRFESPEDNVVIALSLPDTWDGCTKTERVVILMRKGVLLFFAADLSVMGASLRTAAENGCEHSPERLLHGFFTEQLERDSAYLEDLEQELAALEDALLTGEKQDCVEEIILLRRRLMMLGRYYDEFLNVLEGILENEDDLLDHRAERSFKSLLNRAERLRNRQLSLHDYVTQVRESYQAQVDISLNQTMKVFTVVTAIFLPLTLIAGWYGMNVQMPEAQWKYGYAFVAALSAVVVAGLVWLLKRKKLF